MEHFDERFEFNRFDKMEQMMDEFQLEKFDRKVFEENEKAFPVEYVPLELKADSLEIFESVHEPIRENKPDGPNAMEFPEHLQQISENIERLPDKDSKQEYLGWEDGDEIVENELPASPFLKPIDKKEELYREIGIMNDEEKEAYWDFIYQTMNKDHKIVMDIPMPENMEYWPPIENEESLSFPFRSMDYIREHPFSKYHWRLKKVFENVKNLGIDYSSISDEEGKNNIHQKYNNLVQDEFRGKAQFLLEKYEKFPELIDKQQLFYRVVDLNSKINKCRELWDKYSNWK